MKTNTEMKARKPSTTPRQYMEFIRAMHNANKPFSVNELRKEHGIVNSFSRGVAVDLGWIKNHGMRTGINCLATWIGPKINGEDQLLRMAHLLMDTVKRKSAQYHRDYRNGRTNKVETSARGRVSKSVDFGDDIVPNWSLKDPAMNTYAPVLSGDDKSSRNSPAKPARKPAKRKSFSILWGMAKWTW